MLGVLTQLYQLLEKPWARLTAGINWCNYIVFRAPLLVTSAWGSGAQGFSEADRQHVTAVFSTCCAVLLTLRWGKYLGSVLVLAQSLKRPFTTSNASQLSKSAACQGFLSWDHPSLLWNLRNAGKNTQLRLFHSIVQKLKGGPIFKEKLFCWRYSHVSSICIAVLATGLQRGGSEGMKLVGSSFPGCLLLRKTVTKDNYN